MLVLGASSLAITAQTPKLILAQAKSPLKVSILTSGPGQQLYALFGHTALRVRDAQSGTDHVYNFGTFDEDTDGFYLKFLAGTLNYQIARTTYQQYMAEYIADTRWTYCSCWPIRWRNCCFRKTATISIAFLPTTALRAFLIWCCFMHKIRFRRIRC